MKLKQSILTVSGFLAATQALAHPGDHEGMHADAHLVHVLTDPWHLMIALAVAGVAVWAGRRWLASRQGVK